MQIKENKFMTNPSLKKADEYMEQRMPERAVSEYLKSMLRENSNVKSYIGIAKAYRELQQYDKAIKHLERAKQISDFDCEVYYELGLNYLLEENYAEAAENFRKTIKLNPNYADSQIQLAIMHELMDEVGMAFSIYEKIIEEDFENVVAHNHKAGLLMNLGYFEEAAKIFFQILSIDENYSRAYLGLGICFDKLERYTSAVRFYRKYIERNADNETSKSVASRMIDIISAIKPKKSSHLKIAK